MEGFKEDELLIKALKGSQKEMNQGVSWILKHSGWRDSVGIQIRKFQMDFDLRDEVFYESLTALTMNIRKNKFQGTSKLKTYFEGICKNILKTKLSRKTKDAERIVTMETDKIIQKESVDEANIEESERQLTIQQTLTKMIGQLGETCKKVLGYLLLDYSMQEIADKLEMERQSIKNRSFKCRSELRTMAMEDPTLMNEIKSLI